MKLHCGGEHDAHAIRKGPDGWWYLLNGNMAGVNEKYNALPRPPVAQPRAGTLMRFTPDLSRGRSSPTDCGMLTTLTSTRWGHLHVRQRWRTRDHAPLVRADAVVSSGAGCRLRLVCQELQAARVFPRHAAGARLVWSQLTNGARDLPTHAVPLAVPRGAVRARLDLRADLGAADAAGWFDLDHQADRVHDCGG